MHPDQHLIPLFFFGTLLVTGFTVVFVFSVIAGTQRKVKNRLERQRLIFSHEQTLLHTRIEVQETTLTTLAHELHDNIAQSLTSCFMQFNSALAFVSGKEGATTIEGAKERLTDAISNVRLLSHSLATGMIECRNLGEAIQAELSRIQAFSGISCSLQDFSVTELEPEQRLLLFRIVQEALQNTLKHAKAGIIGVTINDTDDGWYHLTVSDDGRGFDPAIAESKPTLGLAGIRERIAMLKGELNIDSAPAAGTMIHITIPTNS